MSDSSNSSIYQSPISYLYCRTKSKKKATLTSESPFSNNRSRNGSFGKEVILDFDSSAICLASTKRDLKNICFRDDRYGSLFQQLGSVEAEGESSSEIQTNSVVETPK